MRRLVLTLLASLVLPLLLSATSGSFRGVIVRGPEDRPGWIWVKGANGMLRRVGVEGARVVYDPSVPRSSRQRTPQLSMKEGAEVRVTADQDSEHEWHASKVEILKIKGTEPVIEPSRHSLDNMHTAL